MSLGKERGRGRSWRPKRPRQSRRKRMERERERTFSDLLPSRITSEQCVLSNGDSCMSAHHFFVGVKKRAAEFFCRQEWHEFCKSNFRFMPRRGDASCNSNKKLPFIPELAGRPRHTHWQNSTGAHDLVGRLPPLSRFQTPLLLLPLPPPLKSHRLILATEKRE